MKSFTSKELNFYKEELSKIKTPWFTKLMYNLWFNFVKKIILYILILLILMFIINLLNYKQDLTWIICKFTIISLIIFGGLFLFANIFQELNIKYYIKKYQLTEDEWNYLINLFKIEF
jgi:type II secretory pathway component PulF